MGTASDREDAPCACTTKPGAELAAMLSAAIGRVAREGDVTLCMLCGEPYVFDSAAAGFRVMTSLEFEQLPNLAIAMITSLAGKVMKPAPPSYLRTMLALRDAADRWYDEQIATRGAVPAMIICMPPDDADVTCLLSDCIRNIARDDPDARAFVEYLDEATGHLATFMQFQMLLDGITKRATWISAQRMVS